MANVVCINGKNPNGRLLFLTSPDMSASNVSELVDVVSSTSLVDESSMIIVASYEISSDHIGDIVLVCVQGAPESDIDIVRNAISGLSFVGGAIVTNFGVQHTSFTPDPPGVHDRLTELV